MVQQRRRCAVRDGRNGLCAKALPGILSSNTEVLSPRLVSLIADLMQDWRRLAQTCVEWVQHQSMALAESLTTGPPAARNAALRERGNEAMKARFDPFVPAP